MPLSKSPSHAAFVSNLREMIRAGHPQNQALAAAYRIKRQSSRKSKKPRRKKSRNPVA